MRRQTEIQHVRLAYTRRRSFRQGALVREHDLAPLTRGLRDRISDFECRHGPAAVVPDGLALGQRLVHLLHLQEPGAAATVHRHLAPPLVAIDVDAIGRLADAAALEARHGNAKPVDVGARADRGLVPAAAWRSRRRRGAEAHALLRALVVELAAPQRLTHAYAFVIGVHAVADAPGQLRGVEIAIAVVDDGRRRAVLEFEIGRKAPRARTLRQPAPARGAHAAHAPATEKPDRVDEMRGMAVDHPAA